MVIKNTLHKRFPSSPEDIFFQNENDNTNTRWVAASNDDDSVLFFHAASSSPS
jgi:hypothetical protein